MRKIHGFCRNFRPDDPGDIKAEPRCQLGKGVSKKGEDVCGDWTNKTWDDITSWAEIVTL